MTTFRCALFLSSTLTWATLFAAAPADAQKAASWPQFLGPQRNGISSETGLIRAWPAGGLKKVWRVTGGAGMSGLVIDRGRLFTLMQTAGQQKLIALDASTGKSVWQTDLAPEYRNAMGNGPRSTPAVDGDRVFAFTGEGILTAVDFATGKVQWSHDVVKELRGKVAEYGMASSPLVVGDLVIVTAGAPGATVVAYEKKSGELAWKAGDDTAGYSSAAILKAGGRRHLVAFTGSSALGINPRSGATLWRYPYVTDYNCNIATPIEIDGNVLLSSGENHGSVLLSLKPTGDTLTVGEVWVSQGGRSVLRNEWQTSILLDGYLYGFDNVGSAGPISHLTCVEAKTGKRVWQQVRFGKGNLIAADGKLFMTTMKGEVVVVRATPKGFEEMGRQPLLEMTRQAPALAGGLLYVRDSQDIVCLDVRAE